MRYEVNIVKHNNIIHVQKIIDLIIQNPVNNLQELQQWLGWQFYRLNCRLDDTQDELSELKEILNKKAKVKSKTKVQFQTQEEHQASLDESSAPKDLVPQDPLEVVCGDPKSSGQHLVLKVPSVAALNQFEQLSSTANTTDAPKFALRLLSVFFSDQELGESNCTYAEGRKLLDQNILLGIKCKFIYCEL